MGSVQEFPVNAIGRGLLGYIAPGPEGSMWFTQASSFQQLFGLVERIAPNGLLTGEFASHVEPFYPVDITQGPDGNMWVTDLALYRDELDRIDRITPLGTMTEFSIPGRTSDHSVGPTGITAGPDGNVWFTDRGEGEEGKPFIGRITPAGKITEFSIPAGMQANLPERSRPMGIAAGSDGNLWFTDEGNNYEGKNLIGRITPAGTITEFPMPTPDSNPMAIALGSDSDMWFTQTGSDTVGRIAPAGAITEFAVPGISGALGGITLGPDGNIWFTGTPEVNPIGWISPTGVVHTLTGGALSGASPSGIAAGQEGNIWFTDPGAFHPVAPSHSLIGRLVTPYPPADVEPPVVSGQAVAGQVLSTSEGAWRDEPSAFAYRWQLCDQAGSDCEDIDGGTEASYVLLPSDEGHTLRAVVTASNVGGEVSSVSGATSVVQLPPTASVSMNAAPMPSYPPLVAVTMTWSFKASRDYTTVRSLVLHSLPGASLVDVTCRGRGCPFVRMSFGPTISVKMCRALGCTTTKRSKDVQGELNLARLFKAGRLGRGSRLSVSVAKPGWIGRSFTFAIRKSREPVVEEACLAPGSQLAVKTC
jgi:streptogramin lyase